MHPIPQILTFAVFFTATLAFSAFSLLSLTEKEPIAAKRAALAALLHLLLALLLPRLFPTSILLILFSLLLLFALLFLASFLPIFNQHTETIQTPTVRKDERDIPFARIRLQKGTPAYQQYYTLHPENEAIDQQTRQRPGLASPQARFNHPLVFAATQASYFLTEHLRQAADGDNTYINLTLSPQEAATIIKNYAHHYGALTTGITPLQAHHVYTHIGRGVGTYGDSIHLHQHHTHAIAFTVEMNQRLVATAPTSPSALESAHQYVEAARIAIQLAAFIRNLGYQARAHIDGNYQVIAPLIARDAGLGEIGRNSLLITPQKGPRVRLGVVTTNLPLASDAYTPNHAVLEFCQQCKRCAQNCPSQSISHQNRTRIDGALQWKIDPISCFNYWNTVGTDCGRCMSVCPFAHPSTPAHNLIRFGIQHSRLFRHLALPLENLFYTKKPHPHPIPQPYNPPSSNT